MNLYSWRKPLLLILVLTLSLVLASVAFSQAEETPEPAESNLTDVSFDGLSLTVPSNWLTWAQGDYVIPAMANTAFTDMIRQVAPDFNMTSGAVNNERFTAIAPQLYEEAVVSVTVTTVSYSPIVSSYGIPVEELDPRQILFDGILALNGRSETDLDFAPVGWLHINDRWALMSVKSYTDEEENPIWLEILVLIVVEETDDIVLVTFAGPTTWLFDNDVLVNTIVTSIRLEGEPLDLAAMSTFTTGQEETPDPESP